MRRFWNVVGVAALILAPESAMAWGPLGHALVARIAARELTPAARMEVEELLGGPAGDRMAAISSWADWESHRRPWTKPWHYVDIEIGSAGYDARRDCAGGDCIVAAIGHNIAILRDRGAPRAARREALMWLIHLVADIHQPLHCADRHDRGGNAVPVLTADGETNLHHVWDTMEVERLGNDATTVAATLGARIAPAERAAWAHGNPAEWADESFRLAGRIYAALPSPDGDGYREISARQLGAGAEAAATQLMRAGVRLAWILDRALRQPCFALMPGQLPDCENQRADHRHQNRNQRPHRGP